MNRRDRRLIHGILAHPRTIPIAIGAVLVIGMAAFFFIGGNNDGPEYRTELVTRGDITATVTATGSVNAVTTVLVGTQVSGTIRNIYVDFNSKVKKGQMIAQIDPDMFEAQAEQAKANLMKAEAQLRDAERTMGRAKELFSRNLIPRSELDTAETNFESSRAQREQAKAALRLADTNLRYTRIISPVDGIVISRSVDVGQTVAASFQTPTLFTIAEDLTKMQVDTNVAESDIGVVSVGQSVEFTVDAYPDVTFQGKVSQIRRAPITVQNVVTYNVVVLVNNRDLKLMPGMTANVSIIIETRGNVVRIPSKALRFRPSERSSASKSGSAPERKGPGVWILRSGKPSRAGITPGISDGTYTEVLSGDLKEGEELIVESLKKSTPQKPSGGGPRMF
jgi:HlyD family secretion protein